MGTRRANGSGSLFKRNGWYYYKSVDETGKKFCRSCKTRIKSEAEVAAQDFSVGSELQKKARLAAVQAYLTPKESNPLLTDAITAYHSHPRNIGQTDASRKEDDGVWKVFTRWIYGQNIKGSRLNCTGKHVDVRRLNDITEEIATEFLTECKASPQSKNKYVRILKRIWKFNGMKSNPWENFRKFRTEPTRKRALSSDEVDLLISSSSGELKILFLIGVYTGLRMQDCSRTRWENYSDDLSTLTMSPHKTKHSSGVIVQIPVHRKLVAALSELPAKKSGWVTPQLAELEKQELSDIIQSHFKKFGLLESVSKDGYRNKSPTVGFHSLRSTFISNCADAGIPLAYVQSLVGHVSPELTQLYYRSNAEHARQFIDRL